MTIKINNITESCEYQISHIIVSKLCGLTLFVFSSFIQKKKQRSLSVHQSIIVGRVITPLFCSSSLTITLSCMIALGLNSLVFKSTQRPCSTTDRFNYSLRKYSALVCKYQKNFLQSAIARRKIGIRAMVTGIFTEQRS